MVLIPDKVTESLTGIIGGGLWLKPKSRYLDHTEVLRSEVGGRGAVQINVERPTGIWLVCKE